MPDIILTTLNAKFIHTGFGLRYLLANMGPLRPQTSLVEFDINQRPLDIVERLLKLQPKIIGFGVYIWNVTQTTEVVAALKRIRPEILIILGGPEISFETEEQGIADFSDYIITGEADFAFGHLCAELLSGKSPATKIIPAQSPDLQKISLPYGLYSDDDIAHRVIYVEASRGCPFGCEFCLSSLDHTVHEAPLEPFLKELERLLERGAKQIKFVDRTFNLNPKTSKRLLEFCLSHLGPGRLFHFEAVADWLPESLRELLTRFPPGSLQLEIGVQSFNREVCALINRRQDFGKIEENLNFLRRDTRVHVHADLIVGLPGEPLESFASGFDRLVTLAPQEIQVGILKRLRGAPIARHDAEWRMVYSPQPPYEILQNKLIGFETMQRLRRFARYWDLVSNSGNFLDSAPLLWRHKSPFAGFIHWSDWLYSKVGRTDSIALSRLFALMFEYLTSEAGVPSEEARDALGRDYSRSGRSDQPGWLRKEASRLPAGSEQIKNARSGKRQARHIHSR